MRFRTPLAAAAAAIAIVSATGCTHPEAHRILMYIGASFEGGTDVAMLELRVWERTGECDEILFADNEVSVVWSHVARSGEYGDFFTIGERLTLDRPYITAREDGNLVYYSFGTMAEVADRWGNVVVELGEGMRTATFYSPADTLVAEGPVAFVHVKLTDRIATELDVVGTGPSFEPGGGRIVYGREGQVYIYDLEGLAEHALGSGLWPRYLDDGRVVAFRDGGEGPGLYVIDPGSGGWSYFGDPDPAVLGAEWWRLAPDGQRVLVDTGDGGFTLQGWAGPAEGDWRYDSELYCE
jgi:hypothetical protein